MVPAPFRFPIKVELMAGCPPELCEKICTRGKVADKASSGL